MGCFCCCCFWFDLPEKSGQDLMKLKKKSSRTRLVDSIASCALPPAAERVKNIVQRLADTYQIETKKPHKLKPFEMRIFR